MTPEELQKHNKETLRRAEIAALEEISFEELEKVFAKWMIIPDPGIIKFVCAFYCANKLSRKAVWAIIIAPSGGGKTEILNSLLDLPDIYEVSLLTPNTFLSGMPGRGDASLLPKVNGKIIMFKDWTSILSMQKDAKAELMSQFREIWDGRMKKMFGNGKIATWEGKVSVLAASTQAVDMSQQQYAHLGERFINYRPVMPEKKAAALRALENDADQEQMGIELRNAMYAFFKGIDFENMDAIPAIPKHIRTELVNLANFTTMARSAVIRDFGMKKEVIFVPASEMPTRFSQQLNALGSGLAMVNKGIFKEEDMNILYKAALDSIPQTNKIVIAEMARADEQTTADIAASLGYPTETIRIYLENLALLKVCKRIKGSGKADKWTMQEEFSNIIRQYEHVEELSKEEIITRSEVKSEPVAEDIEELGTSVIPDDIWDK